MAMIDRNFTFATNGTVSAADLHNLIDSATIYQDLITGQLPITSVGTNYELLIADATNPNAAPNAVTVYDLFEDALTAGTYTNANISAALTYGTATGTRLVSTNATITTGTITTGVIPTLTSSTATFGTTTSTAATITNGTITNLASTTGTIATLNSTTGTIATLNSTTGTIATLNSTTGTIATLNSTTGVIPALTSTTLITTGTGTAAAPAIVPTGDTNTGIFFPAADTIAFSEGGAEAIRIDSSGNLLVGVTSITGLSPSGLSRTLALNSTDANISGSVSYVSNGTAKAYHYVDSDGLFTHQVISSGQKFYTNNTERLRIDSSGNLLVGTTTAIGKFTVEANGTNVSSIPLTTNSIVGSGTRFAAGFYYSGTKVGSIEVTASATSYVTSSDYRLKTNLEQISNGIERVKQLPVYNFNWIADEGGNKVDGFVAHEAKAIVPECVSGEKDAVDADGNPIYQGIDQSKIVPLLTAALKEAIAKIEVLEFKVAALEAA